MTDPSLGELERRWQETGAVRHQGAWFVERIRVGELPASEALPQLSAIADSLRDPAGTPIDSGVRTLVLNLWSLGFWTSFSCEGHLFEGLEEGWSFCGPRVVIESPSPFNLPPLDILEGDPTAAERTQLQHWMVSNLR